MRVRSVVLAALWCVATLVSAPSRPAADEPIRAVHPISPERRVLGPLPDPPGSLPPVDEAMTRRRWDRPPRDAEYLIITDVPLLGPFEAFAAWKRRHGTRAQVQTLRSIQRRYPAAVDDAERIRFAIRDAYARGTRWVLLGGDTEVIPTRMVHSAFILALGQAIDYPSDFYYSCLDGTWNGDGDAWYGERADDADVVPEVFVGRAPVRTPGEAKHFVERTIAHAEGRAAPDSRQWLLLAEVLLPKPWDGTQESLILDLAQSMDQLHRQTPGLLAQDPRRLYENHANPAYLPGALSESKASALAHLDRGYALTMFSGTGSTAEMSVGPDRIGIADVLGLENRRGLTHLVNLSASTHDITTDCIGEAFLRARRGGAVTSLGPSSITFVGMGMAFLRRFAQLVFEEGLNTVGEVSTRARHVGTDTYILEGGDYQLSPILLGDPQAPIFPPEGRRARGRHTSSEDLAAAIDAASGADLARPSRAFAAWPNPARDRVVVRFELDGAEPGDGARMAVFDLAGRRVRDLVARGAPGGIVAEWDLADAAGRRVDEGVYFVSVERQGTKAVRRVLVVR